MRRQGGGEVSGDVPAGGGAGATSVAFAGRELGRQRFAWYSYGWASHTFETTVISVFLSRYLPAVATNAVGVDGHVYVLGIPISPGSLFAYTVSFCAIALVFLMPVVGAIADRTGRRKELMLGISVVGAVSCAAMWFVYGTDWQLGTALMIVAYLTYTCAKVVYNSMLPDRAAADDRDRISSIGWAAGYIGSGVLLAGNFVLSFVISDRAVVARLALSTAGIWWVLFSLVPLVMLRNAPPSRHQRQPVAGSAVTAGFRELAATLRHVRRYPHTLLFLVAFLVYYDGITTVTSQAAVYGQYELKLSDSTLLSAILVVQFAGFGGALLLGRLAGIWGAKRVIAWSLVVWIGVVTAAYFLQAGSAVQFYLLATTLSIVLGGTQALSRSLYSTMIPTGKEGEYFGLYEISSSGGSAFGPLLFGLAYQSTHSYRVAIFSVVVFFVVGLVLLLRVNVARAAEASGNALPASLAGRRAGASRTAGVG